MIGIILTVFKVIGIILLIILCILLLLLLLALFVPVRYEAGVRSYDDLKLYVKATYLLHILSFIFEYDKDNDTGQMLTFKIFGRKLSLDKSKKGSKENKVKKKPKEEKVKDEPSNELSVQEETKNTSIPESDNTKRISKEELKANEIKEEAESEKTKSAYSESVSKSSEKDGFKDKASELNDNAKKFIEKAKTVYEELSDERNKAAFSHFIKSIKHLFKCYMPRKLRGEGVYSLGDPSKTGKLLGFLYLFPPILRQELKINNADFESDRAYFKGEVYIKGHIRFNHAVVQGIGILLDKNCRRFIKRITNRRK